MTLADDLLDIPERETGGSLATARLDYQAQWALNLVFEAHKSMDDYAVAIELHDDVLLLDSSSAPEEIRFYQVKTKNKLRWTLGKLFSRKKGKDGTKLPSIIGRLMTNYEKFPKNTASLNFVSNASCNILDDAVSDQPFSSCDPKEFTKFKSKLKAECPQSDDKQAELLRFVLADLSLKDADGHLQGKLVKFVQDTVGAGATYKPDSLYRLVTDEFRRRAKHVGKYKTFAELTKAKAVCRHDVEGWLHAIVHHPSPPTWQDVSANLSLPPLELVRMHREWTRYEAEVLNPGNQAILQIRDSIASMLEQCDDSWAWEKIFQFGIDELHMDAAVTMPGLTEIKLKTMILYEAYADETGTKIQAFGAQSKEAAK